MANVFNNNTKYLLFFKVVALSEKGIAAPRGVNLFTLFLIILKIFIPRLT